MSADLPLEMRACQQTLMQGGGATRGLLSQEEEEMHQSLEWINSSPYIITMYNLFCSHIGEA